ncbi:hypothetical protein As57867_016673, partial [Aphanomyces stellatus]
SRVAVIMERCLEFPIGLLAVLKAGAAMVPLDASFPVNRLAYILSDSGVSVIVSTTQYTEVMQNLKQSAHVVYVQGIDQPGCSVLFEKLNCHRALSNDEAFIVYTSGSTGQPKGVPVLHGGVVNCIENTISVAGMAEGTRVMQFMAIGFDGCQCEVWASLSSGATLVLRSDDFLKSLATVNVLTCTPTGLSLLGNPSAYPSLTCVWVAGEHLPRQLKDLWATKPCFMNAYGPSECAIMTHIVRLNVSSTVTIGKPIPNVNSYVLDPCRRLIPLGVIGEIHLGGICVSPGYINLTKHTSERFLDDPISICGGQMFRTGDFARLHPSGNFEILGRDDSQVKLKGYRIELDEVANAMMSHPQVVAAAAIVKDKSHLVGFFSPSNVNISDLQDIVSSQLPVYMIPAVWVGLDEMPQNANGKIDKKALESLDVVVDTEELESDAEKRMASVWARVLDVDVAEIGRQTSFYAVGGDSLSVIKVVAACKEVGITISVTQLLKHLVLWKVAASIADGELDVTWPRATLSQGIVDSIVSQNNGILEVDNCLVYPVTPLQAGMVSATLSNPSSYLMQIPMRTKQESNMANLCDAFRQIVRTNDILRTTFVTSTSGIYQVIHPATDEFKVARASTIDVDEFLRLDYARGFTIGDAYFVRLTIVGDQSCVLTIHHALYDGWTVSMIMSDLHDAMHGNTMVHRPSFCDAVDYICAQDKNATQVFWRAYLSGYEPSVVGTHQGKPFPNEHDNTPLSMISQLPLAEITAAARRVKLTVAELTKLAWANTLRKYTRQNDVVFGCVMANRNIPIRDADKILGPLLSTIPCRVTFDDSLSTEQWIDVVIAERSTVVAHAHASLLDIKRWSDIEGELFDT